MRRVTDLKIGENTVPEHSEHHDENPIIGDVYRFTTMRCILKAPLIIPDYRTDLRKLHPPPQDITASRDLLVRPVGVRGIIPDTNVRPFLNGIAFDPDFTIDPENVVTLKRDTCTPRHMLQLHIERRKKIYNLIGSENAYKYEFRDIMENGTRLKKLNVIMHAPLQLSEEECKTMLRILIDNYTLNNMYYNAVLCWPVLFSNFFSRQNEFGWYSASLQDVKKKIPNVCSTTYTSYRIRKKGAHMPGFDSFYKDILSEGGAATGTMGPPRWYTNPLEDQCAPGDLLDIVNNMGHVSRMNYLSYLLLTQEDDIVFWIMDHIEITDAQSLVEYAICFAIANGFLQHTVIKNVSFDYD